MMMILIGCVVVVDVVRASMHGEAGGTN